jgi:hypothetical protein
MKKLLLSLLLLFSLNCFSQKYIVSKVNDTIVSNSYVYESKDFPKKVVIKVESNKLEFDNVVPGDFVDGVYSLYSKDDNFKFSFSKMKVIVYTLNKDKWKVLYNIDLKDENKSDWFKYNPDTN